MTQRRDIDATGVRAAGDADPAAELVQMAQEVGALLIAWQDRGITEAQGASALLGFTHRMLADAGFTCAELAVAIQRCFRSYGLDASLLLPDEDLKDDVGTRWRLQGLVGPDGGT